MEDWEMASNISGVKLFCNMQNIIEQTPITADIFLNDYCNNKCPWCTYARYGERNGQFMSLEDFVSYSNILRNNGVKGFILTGGGEPTISRDFDAITKYLESNGLTYGINTNFNVYKEISPKYLKVSLDGWDEDSYEAQRGVRRYKETIDNIKRYLAFRNKEKTSVGIQMIATSVKDVDKFYNAHKDLDIDYMNLRPMESTLHKYYDSHNEKDVLNRLYELQRVDSRVVVNYKWNYLRTEFEKCYAHFAQIALNQRGEVIYCCHKPYEIIGHITDKDIWEKFAYAKTNMSMCDIPCRLSGPNKLYKDMLMAKDVEFI